MDEKFHISRRGTPAICRAESGNCPLGSDDEHYATREEAREAFESSQNTWTEKDSETLRVLAADIRARATQERHQANRDAMRAFLSSLQPPLQANFGQWGYTGNLFGGNVTFNCGACGHWNYNQRSINTNVIGAPAGLETLITSNCERCSSSNAFLNEEGGILRRGN